MGVVHINKGTPMEILEQVFGLMTYPEEPFSIRDDRISALREKYPSSTLLSDEIFKMRITIDFLCDFGSYLDFDSVKAIADFQKKDIWFDNINDAIEYLENHKECDDNFVMPINTSYEEILNSVGNMRLYSGFLVAISCCSKSYNNEFDKIYAFFKPWFNVISNDMIGHIEDEDHTLSKSYYYDEKYFEEEMEERKIVCVGCSKYCAGYECSMYEYCQLPHT